MRAKKGELYNFIEARTKAEKAKVQKEINTMEEEMIKEPLRTILVEPFKGIKTRADNLHDLYEKYIETIGKSNVWEWTEHLRDLNQMMGKPVNMVNNYSYRIMEYLNGRRHEFPRSMLTREQVEKIEVVYNPLQQRMKDLDTLERELNAIVKTSGSGKIAYHNMIALGVDMTSFVPEVSHLPAVQKLSVDVCVMNGGC